MDLDQSTEERSELVGYDKGDYILIRDDKVIAVSGNEDFDDGAHPVTVLATDTITVVIDTDED